MDHSSPVGLTICRSCRSSGLQSVLDLGFQPLANELLAEAALPEAVFPLHLRICPSCALGQVGDVVSRERIFGDYPYLSSVSSSWVAHARAFAKNVQSQLQLDESSLVIEVASNDGYLLREFLELGLQVMGIEPAQNVAALARAKGVTTMSSFFGRDTAQRLSNELGHPRLIVANNVLAHVPDLDDFVGGLALLAGPDTVITVENPSFLTLLQETHFDTIYHEHFSYLSAFAVRRLVAEHGLELIRVEDLSTHGGSYRYWIARQGACGVEPSVACAIDREKSAGLLSPELWTLFARRSKASIAGLRSWLEDQSARGRRVAAYGAAAKGNTLLNAAGVGERDLDFVVDGSTEKQGRFLPGSHLAVLPPEALKAAEPTDVIILPWNLASEIVPLVGALVPNARCWTAIPEMKLVGP